MLLFFMLYFIVKLFLVKLIYEKRIEILNKIIENYFYLKEYDILKLKRV